MIRVYGIAEQLNPIKGRMSDVIHGVVQRVLGLPEDKRAQRFFPMDRADLYAPGGRSVAYTVIEIQLMEGRSVETKKALIHGLFGAFERELGIAPVDVEITLLEQPPHCWGFRGTTGDEAQLDYRLDV
jgi:phenylpyruvate tautomerase PptA (4-oxalocrotonate tautomerase family)